MPYFWYQKVGGEEAWHVALSDQRQSVISDLRPTFVTVLDANAVPDESWGRAEYAAMRYYGPLYFDFDSEDIAESIKGFHELLAKLDEGGVKLSAVRFYATGGRGFHIEIPEAMVNPKVARLGTALLPYVYREMAEELATDCLDLKVYTARKGRMWRVPGNERANGKFKVSLSLEEALAMTPELYDDLTSSARPEHPRDPPVLSVMLSAMFMKASERIDKQVKARAKFKGDTEALARFKGEFPDSVQRLMNGEGVLPGVGFNKLAMQLAITANALGKTEEQLVEACEGLVQNHSSDSSRYNSPRKRKEELRRMHAYTHDNPLYEYSNGGIKSMCAAGVETPDLENPMQAHAGIVQGDDEELPEDLKDIVKGTDKSLLEGLVILKEGIYHRKPDGAKKISNISFSKPNKLVDSEDNLHIGLEVDIAADDIQYGRQLIPMQTFKSRATLNEFCTGRGAIFNGNDVQAAAIQLILTRNAVKANKVTYIVRKEGLDIIRNPEVRDHVQKDVIWASADSVLCHNEDIIYRFSPKVANSPVFKTDLLQTTSIEDTPETRQWLHALLSMNHPRIVAQMVGWFVSCFHKQFYQAAYSQFPLLHPNGTAGSGKTQTTKLLANMFFVTSPVHMLGASSMASSNFALKSAFTGSASIPVIIDEYKPSELGAARYDFLLQHFRMIYNQAAGSSGGINRGGSESSFRDITQYTYSAPTVYLGESQEMQTAIVQRTVAVGFSSGESKKHEAQWDVASAECYRHLTGQLGRHLMELSLEETVESRVAAMTPVLEEVRAKAAEGIHVRQIFNLAVVICGLNFLGYALRKVFGTEFDEQILGLRTELLENMTEVHDQAMAESSKVLNDMAMITRTEVADTEFAIRESFEFIVGDGWMELMVKESFIKYFAWANRKGFKPLYSTPEAFINSLSKNPAIVDVNCFDSKLRRSPMSKIFRLSLETLTAEGVETFKSKSLG